MSLAEFTGLWQRLGVKQMRRYLEGKLKFQNQRRERMRELYMYASSMVSNAEADRRFGTYLQAFQRH